jgi:hypothetical protein
VQAEEPEVRRGLWVVQVKEYLAAELPQENEHLKVAQRLLQLWALEAATRQADRRGDSAAMEAAVSAAAAAWPPVRARSQPSYVVQRRCDALLKHVAVVTRARTAMRVQVRGRPPSLASRPPHRRRCRRRWRLAHWTAQRLGRTSDRAAGEQLHRRVALCGRLRRVVPP